MLKKLAALAVIFLIVASFFNIFLRANIIVPVLAAEGSFGHTALGTTIGVNGFAAVYVSAFQAPVEANNGIMTEIVCAVRTDSGSGLMMPVVYAPDGQPNQFATRDPSTLLSTGAPVPISPSLEWKHMPLSTPVTIQGGQIYYLGYVSDVGTYPSQDYRNPPPTPTSIYEMELAGGWGTYPNPPSPFGNVTYVHAGVNVLAVYAVYTIAPVNNDKPQYKVNFVATGLDSDATGENATGDLGSQWVEDGASLPFTYSEVVLSNIEGKRYVLSSVNATSPLTVAAPTTITASYTTQYQVSFVVNPSDGGTITQPATTNFWVNAEGITLSAMPHEGYEFSSWNATGPITFASPLSNSTTVTATGSGTVTASFSAVSDPYASLNLLVAIAIIIIAIVTASIVGILISAAITHRRNKRRPPD